MASSPAQPSFLTISELSARSGVAPSALRFYEGLGLITATRTAGNQRRYPRHALRRVAFIRAGRQLGLELREISESLALLPAGQAPTRAQWSRAARAWQARIDAKIAELQRLSTTLNSCIGCGCLSLRRCALYNPQDAAAELGQGARWLLGDEPPDPAVPPADQRLCISRPDRGGWKHPRVVAALLRQAALAVRKKSTLAIRNEQWCVRPASLARAATIGCRSHRQAPSQREDPWIPRP